MKAVDEFFRAELKGKGLARLVISNMLACSKLLQRSVNMKPRINPVTPGRRAHSGNSQRVLTLLVVLVPTLFISTAYAQLYTSNIVGTVTDSTGAVVPGAQVNLLNIGTGVKQDTKTNQAGDYVFQYLETGTYTLTAEAKGFKRFVQENILLQPLSKVSVNVALEPGPVNGGGYGQGRSSSAANPNRRTIDDAG